MTQTKRRGSLKASGLDWNAEYAFTSPTRALRLHPSIGSLPTRLPRVGLDPAPQGCSGSKLRQGNRSREARRAFSSPKTRCTELAGKLVGAKQLFLKFDKIRSFWSFY